MNILALEFSSPRRSVAVCVNGSVRGQAAEEGARETQAFALIEGALKQAEINRQDVECIAVGLGPGSYAGIRIAVAIAQGWQLACGVKLLGMSSAHAVAAHEHERGWRGELHTLIDAQRKEVFYSSYAVTDKGVIETQPFQLLNTAMPAGRCVRFDVLTDPAREVILPEAATLARLAAGQHGFIAGPDLAPIYLRKAEFVKAPTPRFSGL